MITLTKQQEEAVKIMSDNFHMDEPITVIAGFAGTGKSSIINYFIEHNNLMDQTRFVTYTGKASLVLQNKGLPATTIHKLVYKTFFNKRTGKFFFRKKNYLEEDIKLIVIDEVSMVPDQLLDDLLSFNIPIIALGDPGQLEPIGKDNGLLKAPDYFLTEIHRQGEGNSIIRLSKHVRAGKPLSEFTSDDNVKIVDKSEVSIPMLMWADQILCGRNNTRRAINNDIRKALGYDDKIVVEGEKMICLRNYWDEINKQEQPLINGTIGRVVGVRGNENVHPDSILSDNLSIDLGADYTSEPWEGLPLDTNILKGYAPLMEEHPDAAQHYFAFDYGYAITTHKAQGSEFDKILVFEEKMGGNHARWLYTAVTRAIDKIVIVKE